MNDSREREEILLGALLINPDIEQAVSIVGPDDFANEAYRFCFQAMLNLHEQGRPIDIITVAAELQRIGWLDKIGGDAGLVRLTVNVPNSLHIEEYARLVEEASIRRKFREIAQKILNISVSSAPHEIPQEALRLVEEAGQRVRWSVSVVDAAEASLELLERLADERIALKTYISPLDKIIGGIPLGETVIVVGDTSAGKTAFALQVAEQNALAGQRVLYVTTESKAHVMVARRVMGLAGLTVTDLRRTLTEAEQERVRTQIIAYQERLSGMLYFDDRSRDIASIVAAIAEVKPAMVIIDHLGELDVSDDNRALGLTGNFGALRAAAKRNDCAMLVIHTQAAATIGDEDLEKVPDLSKIFDWAKGLRYQADMIWNLVGTKTTYNDGKLLRLLWTLKDREGERYNLIKLAFDPRAQWFEPIAH